MKKIAALLLALVMLFTVTAFAEEELASVELTTEVTFDAAYYGIGETGVGYAIPADWVAADADQLPEGYVCAFTAPDNSITISFMHVATDMESIYAEVLAMKEAGTITDLGVITVNEISYLVYATPDDLYNIAYVDLNETTSLMIAFGTPAPLEDTSVVYEILGSVFVTVEDAE